ncbi:MAG: MFS transporter [Planctomycetota bacterium]
MNTIPSPARHGAFRWLVLLIMSLVIFANYYLYDSFSTLKETLQKELSISSTDYGLIRGFYNVPNTFLFIALLGGIFLDRFGIRRTGFAFALLCALGGVVTAYGVSPTFRSGGPGYELLGSFLTDYSPEIKMMILGRLLFGLGAETQIVMLNKVLAKWFNGKELALAFGLNLGVARVGSALGMSVSPRIAESSYGWNAALWVAALVMLSGFLLLMVYVWIDFRDDRARGRATADDGKLAPDEKFRLSDLTDLLKNRSYLLIALLCTAFYSAVFPFQDYLADLLTHKYGYSSIKAGDFTSLIPWGAAVFTILFGAFVDWKGKRATLMIGGAFLLTTCILAFGLTGITPWILVPCLGIAFSLVPAALWPAVALIVEERRLGTAYGLMTWMQNLGWWAMTNLAGIVLDSTNPDVTPEAIKAGTGRYDYSSTLLLFCGTAALGLVLALALKRADRSAAGHGLELPSGEAAALNAARKEREAGKRLPG